MKDYILINRKKVMLNEPVFYQRVRAAGMKIRAWTDQKISN